MNFAPGDPASNDDRVYDNTSGATRVAISYGSCISGTCGLCVDTQPAMSAVVTTHQAQCEWPQIMAYEFQ